MVVDVSASTVLPHPRVLCLLSPEKKKGEGLSETRVGREGDESERQAKLCAAMRVFERDFPFDGAGLGLAAKIISNGTV